MMKDAIGHIIYVGKSKNLKNRVRSYFQNGKTRSRKLENLVKNVKDLDYIETDTEFEALLLENQLIKKLDPRYNKKLKNPRSYTYIAIRTGADRPGIRTAAAKKENDGSRYFGPFPNRTTVEKAIRGLKEFLRIDCTNPSSSGHPCLNYSLGLCFGICLGGEAAIRYRQILSQIALLLSAKDAAILKEMKEKMKEAAARYDFETAARYRDYWISVRSLIQKEQAIRFAEKRRNIALLERLNEETCKLFLIKGNQILSAERLRLDNRGRDGMKQRIKSRIVSVFGQADASPQEMHKENVDEAEIIYQYLRKSGRSFLVVPKKWLQDHGGGKLDEGIDRLLAILRA
ncbi:GIY-YIG nuclease family protein [Caldibacillus debilis]|uniref:GIY-YIG nuclease family protein n=1 Tax=Caldibacillus debilis TaxID=301148 RepID=UPI002FDACCEC